MIRFQSFLPGTCKQIILRITTKQLLIKKPKNEEKSINAHDCSNIPGGKVLSVFSIGANVASLFTGWLTGDADAWINWYGGNKNEIGKVYYHDEKDCYWVINHKNETRVNGVLTRAVVTYDVFEGFIWDADENKYMGAIN
ncbi:MAG: hypothetical protein ACQUHE_14300 [Bacteroidia bacterium]